MEEALTRFNKIKEFDNLLVADEEGTVIYFDVADLAAIAELGLRPEDFIGNKVTSFYTNLTDKDSTIMQVLRYGKPIIHHAQQMLTKVGTRIYSISSTYPIIEQNRIIGAVEFSKHVYQKENVHLLDQVAPHIMYRKNNTIYTIDDLHTVNEQMLAIKEQIRRVAMTNSPVVIYGKTGTGKEVVAQAIHNASSRFAKPFLTINCAALPENGIEVALFGTVKGFFAGAEELPGLFEQANGGTVFLDNIEQLPIHFQSKLLTIIEEKKLKRLGSHTDIFLDFRVISATAEHPEQLLEEQRLREDLYYRLTVVELSLPELKDRKEDIPLLFNYFVQFYNRHLNVEMNAHTEELLAIFEAYSWPGNIREMKNAIERLFIYASDNELTIANLPKRMVEAHSAENIPQRTNQERKNLRNLVEAYEKQLIAEELQDANGVLAETSRRLGLSKQSLKYKLTKYELR